MTVIMFAMMAVAHAGAWLLAAALQRRFAAGSASANLTGAFVLHALLVTLAVLLAGNAGLLTPWALTALGVAMGGIGAASGGVTAMRSAADFARSTWRELTAGSPILTRACAAVLGFVVLRHLFNAWVLVPCGNDEYEYHLPKLAWWIQTGSLQRPDMLDTRSYFPAGQQVLQAWWTVIVRHDVLIEAATIEAAALFAVGTAAMARRLGVDRPWSLAAGTIATAVPGALIQGTSAMNDITAAAFVVAAFALTLRPTRTPVSLALAAAALCIGAGVKPTTGFAAPGVILAAWFAWRRRDRAAHSPRPALLWLLAGLSAFAGAYWYGMNFVEYGNPFYPVPVGQGGARTIGVGIAKVVTAPMPTKLWNNTWELVGKRVWTWDGDLSVIFAKQAGWGALLAASGMISALWLAVRERAWRLPIVCFSVAAATTLVLSETDDWFARFVLWIPALLACAVAESARRAGRDSMLGPIVAAACLLNVVVTLVPPTFRSWEATWSMASTPWRERDTWKLVFGRATAERGAPLLDSSPVMSISFNFPVYCLARGDFRRRIEHTVTNDPRELALRMRARGCRWLVVRSLPPHLADAVQEGERRGWFRFVETEWLELTDAAPGGGQAP